MRTLLIFMCVSIVVLGVGPWFIIPVFTGQPVGHVSSIVLKLCQIFFFAPLSIILIFIGIKSLINHIKSNKDTHAF